MSGIPSWAYVGAEVICIKRGGWTLLTGDEDGRTPTFGNVCVIIETGVDAFGGWIALDGYPPMSRFDVQKFRPVKTIEDDISEHFAHHLKTPARTSIRAGERA
jgi:hypothetical protein